MCWSRKGVPGSKRSEEAETPFLGPAAEPNFRSERAAAWSPGWSAYRGPPRGTTRDEHERRLGRLLDDLGRAETHHASTAIQHPSWLKELGNSRHGVSADPAGRLQRLPVEWGACARLQQLRNGLNARAAACALGGRCVPTPLTTPRSRVTGGCPVQIRTPNQTPETNTKGAGDDCSTASDRSKTIAPAPAVQRSRWQGAEGARDGVQPHPRWPACEANAYRRSPAPAPGAEGDAFRCYV